MDLEILTITRTNNKMGNLIACKNKWYVVYFTI